MNISKKRAMLALLIAAIMAILAGAAANFAVNTDAVAVDVTYGGAI